MNNIPSTLVILSLLYLPLCHGESHLVCKTVSEIFGSGEDTTSQIRRGAQGPPGKRGPQGQKGDRGGFGPKGVRGDPGVVDYERINATVQESLELVFSRMEKFQKFVSFLCPIWIERNCFKPLTKKSYTRDEALHACSQRSSKLADIRSEVTFDFIMNTIRLNFLSGSSHMDFWLGMAITPSTRKVVLSDGTDAPYRKWYPGYPMSSGRTGMVLRVLSDSTSPDQYFWNEAPSNRYYALCQFEL